MSVTQINGHRRDVPIVGQPFTLKGWFPTVQIICNCDGKEPLMIVGTQRATACPSCGKAYQIAALTYDHRQPQALQVQLAMGVPNKPEGAPSE